MTDELKTLKDIEYDFDYEGNIQVGIYQDKIRQEAIKWVKASYTSNKDMCDYLAGRRDFIKGFFNLTEEDLK